jgi:hypothetical protein
MLDAAARPAVPTLATAPPDRDRLPRPEGGWRRAGAFADRFAARFRSQAVTNRLRFDAPHKNAGPTPPPARIARQGRIGDPFQKVADGHDAGGYR